MSDAQFPTFFGSVEFEPETKDVNGKTVTQFQIKLANNSQETKVRVTIWPELAAAPTPKRGDFVAVTGKYSSSASQDGSREFHSISASAIAVLSGFVKSAAPNVVQRSSTISNEPAF